MSVDLSNRWQVDRHIPVAVLLAIVVQTGGIAFFFGHQSARLAELEAKISAQASGSERLARVETKIEAIGATLQRLEGSIAER